MTLSEMHVWFRQMAQQMGMQNVRAILPEQIDLLINTSITDTINQIIKQNIGITNDRVITDNSKIGQINAFSTLYKVTLIDLTDTKAGRTNYPFIFIKSDRKIGRLRSWQDTKKDIPDYLYIVDFSLNYIPVQDGKGYPGVPKYGGAEQIVRDFDNGLETNFFPVRLIDDAYLADTLNDFILKNRLRSPIIVNYNNSFDLYIDEFHEVQSSNDQTRYVLQNNLIPYQLRMSYIAKPAVVRYREDLGEANIECDLPEYMHIDILKHAVDLYRIAVSGSLQSAQDQDTNQQRENIRNNYRNEGNTTPSQQ